MMPYALGIGRFTAEFAKLSGIEKVLNIPKEFNEIEYEVKFDIAPILGKSKEPSVLEYMNSFDFPASKTARFLKDPVNLFAEGVNNFYGDLDEKLVVIEKGGNLYLKEKGPVIPLNFEIQGRDIVVKRTEKRYPTSFSEAVQKVEEIFGKGSEYKGKIRKEKGDFFVLDTSDGRIYSASLTRAHLIKKGEPGESDIQRQLEFEYAGYIPGFSAFEKDSEEQIVRGMVDLAKHVAFLYNEVPVKNGWRAKLSITGERKFDFINNKKLNLLEEKAILSIP